MASRLGSMGWASCALALSFAAEMGACGGEKFTAATVDTDAGDNDAGAVDASGDAGTSGFCDGQQGKHFFCDDWDKGDIKSGWDTQAESRYASAKLDTVSFRSAPKSFNATTTHAVLQIEETTAILQKDIGRLRQITMEFDMSIDAFGANPTTPDLDLALFTILQFSDVTYALGAAAPNAVTFFESTAGDAGTSSGHPVGANLPVGAWVHVKIDLSFATTPSHVKVTFDTNTVLDANLTSPPPPNVNASLTMGLYLRHAPNLWNLHFDNLIVDKQ